MIIAMQKYSFLIYHKEYSAFLNKIQDIGVLHVIEKDVEVNNEIIEKQQILSRFDKVIKYLDKREVDKTDNPSNCTGMWVIDDVISKKDEIETLNQELVSSQKELVNIEPWGDFSSETISKLHDANYNLRFFVTSQKRFNEDILTEFNAEIISHSNNQIYFIIFQYGSEEIDIDAVEVKQPNNSISEKKEQIKNITDKLLLINRDLDELAKTTLPLLRRDKKAITANLKYDEVVSNTTNQGDNTIKLLEGWIPKSKQKQIDDFLNKSDVLCIVENATKKEDVPVLLKNNRFSKLFEPIGKMFSLPSYSEIDLTVFFAPFFMMFFGFCLGDAGYGLLFIIGAGLYKFKASKEIKLLLSLVQILGVATVIFGAISGTFFGINLIDTNVKFLDNYKGMFLNPDNMFNLALALGALQIVFGMFIKAINQIKQFGIMHSLATFGWLTIIMGGAVYYALTKFEIIGDNKTIIYMILSLGGFLIIFFSDVEISIPARIGKGVWDIYSTVTGIFGDILSYIRLFALGLSSAILGFVVNDIAIQILGSNAIIGPIFFVIFLLLGHGLNIMISSLGSFVHPMRLTFVEFYKNAGFTGGGKEYKPFSG